MACSLFYTRRRDAMAAKFYACRFAIPGQIKRPAIVAVSGDDDKVRASSLRGGKKARAAARKRERALG